MSSEKQKNKGTGAGGAKTNKNAAKLENKLRNTYSNAITTTKRLQEKSKKILRNDNY